MLQHHRRAVEKAIAQYSTRAGVAGIVLIGSLARGEERPNSDVDLLLVLERRGASDGYAFFELRPDYEGAAFDVKVLTLDEVRAAPAKANDAMRACIDRARVVWAMDARVGDELTALIAATALLSEDHWERLQAAFIAQAAINGGYFFTQGRALENPMMAHFGALHFAFALGRAILSLNHIVYGGPKYMEKALARCAVTIPNLTARLRAFMSAPDPKEGSALFQEVLALAKWPIDMDLVVARYVEDNEFSWLTGVAPPEYR